MEKPRVTLRSARVGGDLRSNFAVARFLSDGTLDSSFNPAAPIPGLVTPPLAPGDNPDAALSFAIDAAGRIVAGGFYDTGGFIDLALARFNPDGSLDTTFGTGGKVVTNVGPGNTAEDLEGLVIQPTGKIIVGGGTAATALFVDARFPADAVQPRWIARWLVRNRRHRRDSDGAGQRRRRDLGHRTAERRQARRGRRVRSGFDGSRRVRARYKVGESD